MAGSLTCWTSSAVVVAGFQVWKEHAPGRYHLWLFPLLLMMVLWPRATAVRRPDIALRLLIPNWK